MTDPDHFAQTRDKSMHFTLSIHIDNDRIETHAPKLFEALACRTARSARERDADVAAISTDEKRARQVRNRRAYPPPRGDRPPLSEQLRDAMEPMFADIADRERLGLVEDYLLAIGAYPETDSITEARRVDLAFDSPVSWRTEGSRFEAALAPSGEVAGRALHLEGLPLRRFWYVHRNNSLSYHLSLKIEEYRHSPQFFFLFSMLQKLVAPKEFFLDEPPSDGRLVRIRRDATPIGSLKTVKLRDSARAAGGLVVEEEVDFWQYVIRLFEADMASLHQGLAGTALPRVDVWNELLKHDPYVEVPGLAMPNVRSMFYFADRVLQELLLPKLEDGTPASRHDMMREDFFEVDLLDALDPEQPDRLKLDVLTDGDGNNRRETFRLGKRLWEWFARVQRDYETAVAAWRSTGQLDRLAVGPIDERWLRGRFNARANEPVRGMDPLFDRDGRQRETDLALAYLFLAGFNQNIIDFVNQDSSEVFDSLDPVYPAAGDDVAEGFFARFANPRSLITYVRKMRSLDTGDEYIGTCPYAFLIHVLTMHNEFLTRDFERHANRYLEDAAHEAREHRWKRAADAFYAFRQNHVVEYDTYHYKNVFRYDTEGKVFEALQRIHGIDIKHAYVMSLVDGAEKRTRDAEERLRRREDLSLNLLVFVVGLFSVLQVTFAMSEYMARPHDDDMIGVGILTRYATGIADGSMVFATVLILLLVLLSVLFVGWGAGRFLRSVGRDARRQRQGND